MKNQVSLPIDETEAAEPEQGRRFGGETRVSAVAPDDAEGSRREVLLAIRDTVPLAI